MRDNHETFWREPPHWQQLFSKGDVTIDDDEAASASDDSTEVSSLKGGFTTDDEDAIIRDETTAVLFAQEGFISLLLNETLSVWLMLSSISVWLMLSSIWKYKSIIEQVTKQSHLQYTWHVTV